MPSASKRCVWDKLTKSYNSGILSFHGDGIRKNGIELLSDEPRVIIARFQLKVIGADLNPHDFVEPFGSWPDILFQAFVRGDVIGYGA